MRYFLLLALFISFSFAHKINLFVTNEENGVNIYSYFASGKPCINCKLLIKNESLQTHLKEEKENEYIKILISLFLIVVIFYVLKILKRKKQ